MHYGAESLIPPLVVILLAILLRASFEPLLIGCITGFVIISLHGGEDFFTGFIGALYKVMREESTVWVILVCGLYGSLIGLIVRSGGVGKFGEGMLRFIRTRKQALYGSWGLGLLIFLDDYLSSLTVGAAMKRITDHHRIPREYLAYIVNATAAPVCIIAPLSTWTIFIGSLLEKSHFAAAGQGGQAYLSLLPFVSYGWIAVAIIPLVIHGIIPAGRLNKPLPAVDPPGKALPAVAPLSEGFSAQKEPKTAYFVLPLAVTLTVTLLLGFDALKGVMCGVVFTFIYYLILRIGTFHELSETLFSGFNTMIFALALVIMSYVLKEVGDRMGMTQYIIASVQPFISREFLPLAVFVALSLISFSTGSSWGLYALAIPLVIPLAQSLGSPVGINIGAVISAGVFGANACLYSDTTILSAQSTELPTLDHALSQLPLTLLVFALTALSYLVMGLLL